MCEENRSFLNFRAASCRRRLDGIEPNPKIAIRPGGSNREVRTLKIDQEKSTAWVWRAIEWWGYPRSIAEIRFRDVAIVLVIALAVWGYVDVRRRGRVVPGREDAHMTDFTVYTAAGAAFFNGQDPYEVTNVRKWYYLYPPLFAILVSPLSSLATEDQVSVWFMISVAAAFGCYFECRKIWNGLDAQRDRSGFSNCKIPARLIGIGAALTVFLPALECLQRGQLGIALVYPLLLGYRLVLTGSSRSVRILGGFTLAAPVVMKLIPALPVGFLILQLWGSRFFTKRLDAPRGDDGRGESTGVYDGRGESTRADPARSAFAVSAGFAFGVLFFAFLFPAACVGGHDTIKHTRTWLNKMVFNQDAGRENKFDIDTGTNQSLSNASFLLAAKLRGGPVADFNKQTRNDWMDTVRAIAERRRADHLTRGVVLVARVVVLALLSLVSLLMIRRGDFAGQAASFGLASAAIVLVSPVAYRHYFVFMLPAVLFAPRVLALAGRTKTAIVAAIFPAALTWIYFLTKQWTGAYGMEGLGIAAWYFAVVAAILPIKLPRRAVEPSDRSSAAPIVQKREAIDQNPKFAKIIRNDQVFVD